MRKPVGMPILGAVLGAVLGVIAILMLQQGAIILPGRLVVFGILGVAVSAGSLALTVVYRRAAVVVIQSLAILAVAFALTGIPALSGRGALTGPCTVTASSSFPDTGDPEKTSVANPFDIAPTGTLDWNAAFPVPYPTWSGTVGLDLAGFAVPVGTYTFDNAKNEFGRAGSEDVRRDLQYIEDSSGLTLTGVYHVFASVRSGSDVCAADMYVRIRPHNLVSGPILGGLWTSAAIVGLIFGVYIAQVRRSRKDADS
jgi:hypothetical protein